MGEGLRVKGGQDIFEVSCLLMGLRVLVSYKGRGCEFQ